MTAADITTWSAAAIAAAVRKRQATAEQVVRAHLERIALRDKALNAFQVVRGEKALDEARELDRRGDLAGLPLAGVPVAIKDNVDVAGEPTRHGSAATAATPAARDDELVARLRRAGAIVIGKTRMPELAIWPVTESVAFGDTRNPWNPERTTGGSSGGSGAAVAARMAPLALGSDGGGSIRIPAACCGVAGLKPGPGVIPLAGGVSEHWLGLSEYGPIARTVEDLGLVFDVLRGVTPMPLTPGGSLKIAWSVRPPLFGAPVAKEVKAAIGRLAQALAGAGHAVQHSDPPYPLDLGWRFARRWLPGIAEDAERLDEKALEPRTLAMVKAGRWLVKRGWQQAAPDAGLSTAVQKWFAGFDVLLTPTLAQTPPPVGKWRRRSWPITMLGVGNWLYTTPWNLTRWPAASVPAGVASDGLPIGAQLVALPGGEGKLLALMAQVEKLQPWGGPPE